MVNRPLQGPWENWASRGKNRDSAAGRDQPSWPWMARLRVAFGQWAYFYGRWMASAKMEGMRKLTFAWCCLSLRCCYLSDAGFARMSA